MNDEMNLLLRTLLDLPHETEWVEFKHQNFDPDKIGEYISALSNSAALHSQEFGYLVWGVEDGTHRPVGTDVQPQQRKIGNEPLENWLSHHLQPRIDFRFFEIHANDQRVVLLRIEPTIGSPASFKGTEWIRVGSVTKKLKDHPGKERDLWRILDKRPFESAVAAVSVTGDVVLSRLDYPKYFELSGQSLPSNRTGIFDRLVNDRLIVEKGPDAFDITNLGALLFAKQIAEFDGLNRKAFRVIRYNGTNRVQTEYEQTGARGYAAGFEGLVEYINDHVPRNEILGDALRRDMQMYPKLAVRELVVNAMIHQDFGMTGTGPMVEIFDDRVEISNPGLPLIDPLRFIDHSPRSRNEILADLMRRLGICEERGSGFDKVISSIEMYQLPPPDIRTDTTHTRVILFAHQDLTRMDKRDRVRACYQHCCLLYVSNQVMTNTTLRRRFKIEDADYPVASRILRDALDEGLVKLEDPSSKSKRNARYIPFWA